MSTDPREMQQRLTPAIDRNRRQVGLALSGGGLRATFFHCGVVDALRERGYLSRITEIASVSGGSILATHLVLNWASYNSIDERIQKSLQNVMNAIGIRDIRNRILRRVPMKYLLVFPAVYRSSRWTASAWLESEYEHALDLGKKTLAALRDPKSSPPPHLSIMATSLSTGQAIAFCTDGVCFYPSIAGRARYSSETNTISLAHAVACSSAFPPMFPPVTLTAAEIGLTDGAGFDHQVTDGGIYDNLGVKWLTEGSPRRNEIDGAPLDLLIVSNAGRPFFQRPGATHKFSSVIQRNMRANDITGERLGELDRSATLRSHRHVIDIRLGDQYDPRHFQGAPSPAQQLQVESTRTDLNRFDPRLIALIRRHGWYLAMHAIDRFESGFGVPGVQLGL